MLSGVKFRGCCDLESGFHDGDFVSTWTDQSGSGNHATGSGSNRPLWVTATGDIQRPALAFTASGVSYLSLPSITYNPSSFTIALALRPTGNDASYLLKFSGGSYLWSDTGDTMHVIRGANASDKNLSAAWLYQSDQLHPKVVLWQYGGTHATHTLRLNGAAQTLSDGTPTDDPGTGSVTETCQIGGNGTLALDAQLYELWVISPVLSAGDRTLLEDYLYDAYCVGRF
ncbi:MAG TPA: hypothetical protein VHK68_00775 [Gemmatimonadales bacterium]|nr:hypothetical protein [Gemmatimonadales bacterium]